MFASVKLLGYGMGQVLLPVCYHLGRLFQYKRGEKNCPLCVAGHLITLSSAVEIGIAPLQNKQRSHEQTVM